jgi:hypothetical protein
MEMKVKKYICRFETQKRECYMHITVKVHQLSGGRRDEG